MAWARVRSPPARAASWPRAVQAPRGRRQLPRRATITLGYIAPFTGSLSGFASADRFVIDTIRNTSAYARGFKVGGKTYKVNIIATDSQSDPNRASQLARKLILNNNVDMLLTSSTPETVNPVAVVAQTEGVPCAATNDPWESWYAGLGGQPGQPEGDVPVLHPVLLRPEAAQ